MADGFASCDDPAGLQAIRDRLGPADVQALFDRWTAHIPTPLDLADQAAGYWWELSMRQVEVSRALAFDAPRHARGFFEAVVADNLDLGRPDQVELILSGRPVRRGRPRKTPETLEAKVVTRGVDVTVNVLLEHSRVKEHLKEGRAPRIETVVGSPNDLGCQRRLHNLDELQAKARAANGRLLMIQRAGQDCAVETALFERISQPDVKAGQRTGAPRLPDPRVMALTGALCLLLNAVIGFTNRSLAPTSPDCSAPPTPAGR